MCITRVTHLRKCMTSHAHWGVCVIKVIFCSSTKHIVTINTSFVGYVLMSEA